MNHTETCFAFEGLPATFTTKLYNKLNGALMSYRTPMKDECKTAWEKKKKRKIKPHYQYGYDQKKTGPKHYNTTLHHTSSMPTAPEPTPFTIHSTNKQTQKMQLATRKEAKPTYEPENTL